jgi:hypothetical protein
MPLLKVTMLFLAVGMLLPGQGGGGFGRMNGLPPAGQSLGGAGFGRILFPGTGAPVAVRNAGPGRGGVAVPPPQAHPGHARTVVVPYPVFYGGYYPYDAPPVPDASAVDNGPNQQAPLVIVNQNFHPDTPNPVLRDYSDANLPEPIPQPQTYIRPRIVNNEDDAPTIYLIAMKDRSIFATVAYWVDGETVNYVTREGSLNHVSIGLVDREFSKRLNDERQVEFKLPAAK